MLDNWLWQKSDLYLIDDLAFRRKCHGAWLLFRVSIGIEVWWFHQSIKVILHIHASSSIWLKCTHVGKCPWSGNNKKPSCSRNSVITNKSSSQERWHNHPNVAIIQRKIFIHITYVYHTQKQHTSQHTHSHSDQIWQALTRTWTRLFRVENHITVGFAARRRRIATVTTAAHVACHLAGRCSAASGSAAATAGRPIHAVARFAALQHGCAAFCNLYH